MSGVKAPAIEVPQIETARLRLRIPDERDVCSLERLFNDPHVTLHYPTFVRPGIGRWWFSTMRARAAADGYLPWTVELLDGTFVGQCGPLGQEVEGRREVEVIWFIERRFWGARYASEAARAAITRLFEDRSLPRIVGLIFPRNAASVMLAERLGYRYERIVLMHGQAMAMYGVDRAGLRSAPSRTEPETPPGAGDSGSLSERAIRSSKRSCT